MHDQIPGRSKEHLAEELAHAMAEHWQGRAVLAQLRSDPVAGRESLRALLEWAPTPTIAMLVAAHGVEELVAASRPRQGRRSRQIIIAGAAIAVVVAVLVTTLVVTRGGSNRSLVTPPLAGTRSLEPSGPSQKSPSPTQPQPVATGAAVVGELSDKAVVTAAENRLASAPWVQVVRKGFSYQARAVLLHTLATGGDTAPPGFHRLVLFVEVKNLQHDRSAPLPFGLGYNTDSISVPAQFVPDKQGGCAYPFTPSPDQGRCEIGLALGEQAKVSAQYTTIPADDSMVVALLADDFGAGADVPDAVPDSTVHVALSADTPDGQSLWSHVDVPLG
jgi:hypothetical protein